jgi:hypothetical protein
MGPTGIKSKSVSIRDKCKESFAVKVAALISASQLDVEIVFPETEAQTIGPPLSMTIIQIVERRDWSLA